MPGFTQTESDLINRAYELATQRIANLEECNQTRPSDIRQVAIDTLRAHQQQIEDLGFFDKEDFSLAEIEATVEAANTILATDEHLEHAHELTLIELESDLAQLVQKLATDEYLFILKACWLTARRSTAFLPRQIPDEVCDEFHVALFNKCQGRLNLIAYKSREVSRLKCLNSDDYSPVDFPIAVMNAGKLSAQEAVDNYITLQKLKQAERAEREASELGVGGYAWSIIGWDSPSDFLIDVGLFLGTGGASKVVRWARRLKTAEKEAKRVSKTLERGLKIRDRAQKLERRIEEIRKAAEKLKKASNALQLPRRLAALISRLEKTAEQVKVVQQIGAEVKADYIRSVASSVLSKSMGLGGSTPAAVPSREVARASILAFLDGTALGTKIKDLRSKVNFAALIAGRSERSWGRLWTYLMLLVARELVTNQAITFAHKRTFRREDFIKDFIDSFTTAVEIVVIDILHAPEGQVEMWVKTIISTNSKLVAEIGKRLVDDVLAP